MMNIYSVYGSLFTLYVFASILRNTHLYLIISMFLYFSMSNMLCRLMIFPYKVSNISFLNLILYQLFLDRFFFFGSLFFFEIGSLFYFWLYLLYSCWVYLLCCERNFFVILTFILMFIFLQYFKKVS